MALSNESSKTIDCVVSGTCVVDLLCRPVRLDEPIGAGVLHAVEPLVVTGGGITSNSGIALARLGMRVSAFSYVGNDTWGPVLRELYRREGLDEAPLAIHPTAPTSTTVVTIDPAGERSFFHCRRAAPELLDAKAFLDRLPLFAQARMVLLGYYSLMPELEPDLPQVFGALHGVGCQTAMDAGANGGLMQPLDRILPHLDVWVPSLNEARHQTGHDDPTKIIETFRDCGAPGLLGVKLGGRNGVLLSPKAGQYLQVPSCVPPGDVVDTTGAGDSFYAGLLAGLLRGLPLEQAGHLGAAAGACCVTAVGGYTGTRDFAATAKIAGID